MPLDGLDTIDEKGLTSTDSSSEVGSQEDLLKGLDRIRFESSEGSSYATMSKELEEDVRYGRTPLNLLIPVESLRMPKDSFGKHYGYREGEVDMLNTMAQACELGRREAFVDGEEVNYGDRKREGNYDYFTGKVLNEKYQPYEMFESRSRAGEDKMVEWLKEKYSAVPVLSEHHQDDERMESATKRFVVQPLEGAVYADGRKDPKRMDSYTVSIAYQEREGKNGPWKTELSATFNPHEMRVLAGIGGRAIQYVPTCLSSFKGPERVEVQAEDSRSGMFNRDKPYNGDNVELSVANAEEGVMATTKKKLEAKLENREAPKEFHDRNATELLSAVATGQRKGAVIIADPNAPAWETEAGLHLAELAGAKMLKTNLAELTGRQGDEESPPVYIAADSQKLLTTLKQMVKDQYRAAEREEERGR